VARSAGQRPHVSSDRDVVRNMIAAPAFPVRLSTEVILKRPRVFCKNCLGFVWLAFGWENIDGRQERKVAGVDERRCPRTQNAGAREDKNDGDRTQVETERRSDSSKSNETRCYIRRRSHEETNISRPRGFPCLPHCAKGRKVAPACVDPSASGTSGDR
jgi:hypothetical protein